MSTYSNYTYARMSLNIVGAHSRIEVGIIPRTSPDHFIVGAVAGTRRKVDAIDDTGLCNHQVEDEYTRLVKRLKLPDDGLQTVRASFGVLKFTHVLLDSTVPREFVSQCRWQEACSSRRRGCQSTRITYFPFPLANVFVAAQEVHEVFAQCFPKV